MKLIKKVEVNYLRSLYGLTASKVGDLNLVFGRNDSGKSNLLRALNLFFNGKTDAGRDLDFDLDMSDPRKTEAREAKGRQFIWIKITFTVPTNYRVSLGSEIAIKRQWNRDGNMTETVSPALDGAGKQSRLTRFLNDIDFTYIPAIKDLTVYADLIERMYGAAAETETLKDATSNFVEAIGGQTSALTEQLTATFGTPTRLAPPTEMERLFRNLDFAHGADRHSLLRQKGDGVKARHLPELLRFINENEARKKFYLWGFEEPENSLDLGAAELEASRFADFSARDDTQVFITSHSPAFYLAQSDCDAEVARFFIRKQRKMEKQNVSGMMPKNAAVRIDDLDDAEKHMEEAGLLQLPFVIRRMETQRQELDEKRVEAEALRGQLNELTKPSLFVEGKHDAAVFSDAITRLGEEDNIHVKQLKGSPSTSEGLFNAVLDQGGINASAPTFFLFDNDAAGRSAHKKLCKNEVANEPIKHQDNVHVWALQPTAGFKKFLSRSNITKEKSFFTAEFLYPEQDAAELLHEIISEKISVLDDETIQNIHTNYWKSLDQATAKKLSDTKPGSVDWFFARGVIDPVKADFNAQAKKRNLCTSSVDAIAATICKTLLSP